MEKITSRQLGRIVFLSVVGMKFVLVPALFSSFSGNDAYIAITINLLIDFLTCLAYLYVIKQNPECSFKEFIERSFGKVFSKVVFILLFIYFLSKSLITLKSTHNYMLELLFDQLDNFTFVVPILLFLWFVMFNDSKSLGRVVEIFFYVVLAGIFFAIVVSFNRFDFINLFPVLNNGMLPLFDGISKVSIAFGDYMVLLVLMGDFKKSKESIGTVIKYSLFAISLIIVFYVLFIGIFGAISSSESLAISDMSLNSTSPVTIGRLDWISIMLWLVALILRIAILIFSANKCLVLCFNFKSKYPSIYIISIIILVLMLVLNITVDTFVSIFILSPVSYVLLAFQILLPISLIVFGRKGGFGNAKHFKNCIQK